MIHERHRAGKKKSLEALQKEPWVERTKDSPVVPFSFDLLAEIVAAPTWIGTKQARLVEMEKDEGEGGGEDEGAIGYRGGAGRKDEDAIVIETKRHLIKLSEQGLDVRLKYEQRKRIHEMSSSTACWPGSAPTRREIDGSICISSCVSKSLQCYRDPRQFQNFCYICVRVYNYTSPNIFNKLIHTHRSSITARFWQ